MMRVVHASHGKFHHHDLARELASRGMLEAFFTGYPRWKLRHEDLPHERVRTFPWVETPYMALIKAGLLRGALLSEVKWRLFESFDRHVAKHMPACDAFIGLSCASLYAGRAAQRIGAVYVCDRGSAHIVVQDRLLCEEYARQGVGYKGIDPRFLAKEQAEYAQADLITVPSEFARKSFLEQGIPAEKIAKVPYGVHLERFEKVADPAQDRFDVAFVGAVSFRKGVPDLLQAFTALRHPRKHLTIVGSMSPDMARYLRSHRFGGDIRFTGHCPQPQLKEILSRSQVMVLPSIEEGLALVMAQAMACGCPVIASEHTGARDLFSDGVEGYIVPIGSSRILAERMQALADDPVSRQRMSEAAINRTALMGGWKMYGDQLVALLDKLVNGKHG
ncbi:MAG: glycosyltransferase [Gammaproteobacteria bacterium]